MFKSLADQPDATSIKRFRDDSSPQKFADVKPPCIQRFRDVSSAQRFADVKPPCVKRFREPTYLPDETH